MSGGAPKRAAGGLVLSTEKYPGKMPVKKSAPLDKFCYLASRRAPDAGGPGARQVFVAARD